MLRKEASSIAHGMGNALGYQCSRREMGHPEGYASKAHARMEKIYAKKILSKLRRNAALTG